MRNHVHAIAHLLRVGVKITDSRCLYVGTFSAIFLFSCVNIDTVKIICLYFDIYVPLDTVINTRLGEFVPAFLPRPRVGVR